MNNAEFNAKIDELWAQTKTGNLPREARFAAIERLTDEYITATGKRPEPAQIDRLATLCLYEEVTDGRLNKMEVEERPILSDRQQERRHGSEASEKWAQDYGVDGRNHRPSTRRY